MIAWHRVFITHFALSSTLTLGPYEEGKGAAPAGLGKMQKGVPQAPACRSRWTSVPCYHQLQRDYQ